MQASYFLLPACVIERSSHHFKKIGVMESESKPNVGNPQHTHDWSGGEGRSIPPGSEWHAQMLS